MSLSDSAGRAVGERGNPRDARSERLRTDLSACTGDGVTYSFMVGAGETYLAAFAVALGFTGTKSGLIAAAPPVAGGIVQLIAPRGLQLVGSPRRWVMLCASLQALSLVFLVIGAIVGWMPFWVIFACASLYWAGALAAASVWNTWVGEIFPPRIRGRYFGKRNRLCQVATLAGLLIGGAIISKSESLGRPLVGFAAAFGIASAARFLSLVYLARQGEPERPIIRTRRTSLLPLLQGRTEYGRFMISLVLLQLAVQVGQPYFNPFMLKALAFDPTTYTIAIAAAFVGRSLSLPIAGRIADRHGARSVLLVSAVGVALLATVWLVSPSPWWIIPTQLLAGMVWGAYELAVFLLLLETIPTDERTSAMTWYYLLNSAAMVVGSLLGAAMLAGSETWAGYALVFVVSTVLRLIATVQFLGLRADARGHRLLSLGTLAVRASAGSIDSPQGSEGGGPADSRGRSGLLRRSLGGGSR